MESMAERLARYGLAGFVGTGLAVLSASVVSDEGQALGIAAHQLVSAEDCNVDLMDVNVDRVQKTRDGAEAVISVSNGVSEWTQACLADLSLVNHDLNRRVSVAPQVGQEALSLIVKID